MYCGEILLHSKLFNWLMEGFCQHCLRKNVVAAVFQCFIWAETYFQAQLWAWDTWAMLKSFKICFYCLAVIFSIFISANVVFSAHLEAKFGPYGCWKFRSCPLRRIGLVGCSVLRLSQIWRVLWLFPVLGAQGNVRGERQKCKGWYVIEVKTRGSEEKDEWWRLRMQSYFLLHWRMWHSSTK